MFSWGYGYVLEGESIGEAAGGDRGSCHDSREWNESRDSVDDAAGELGSTIEGSPTCGSRVSSLTLSRCDVDGVRSLKAGAVAARRDAKAASLVRLTRNCPEPSSAPPLACSSSVLSVCSVLVEVRGDCSKVSRFGEGLRPRSVFREATIVASGRVAPGTAIFPGCAAAVGSLVPENLLVACGGTFFVIHIGSRFFTGTLISFSFDMDGDASCEACLTGSTIGLSWALNKGASVLWAILSGTAVSGGDDNGSGSSNNGPHMTEDTARRSCLEGESTFSESFRSCSPVF